MGESALVRLRKAAKKVTRPVARPLEAILKPIAKPLRPVSAAYPVFTGFGLFVQPKVMGVKSAKGQKIYTQVQRAGRIVAGTVAVVYTGGAAASAMGFGAGAGTGGGFFSSLGALKAMGLAGATKVKDFLVSKGVKPSDAMGLAKDVLTGQRPVPTELDAQMRAEATAFQARGGPGAAGAIGPLLLLGGLGVVGMTMMRRD